MLHTFPLHEPPSDTALNSSTDIDHVLSSLQLIEQLARDCAVPFNRVHVKTVLREHVNKWESEAATNRLHGLPPALSAVGMQGRIRQLSVADAMEFCRNGASLVTAVPAVGLSDAWVLVRSAGPSKVRLASERGADTWITREQFESLLEVDEAGSTRSWLFVEPALPCASNDEHSQANQADDASQSDHHHSHLPPLRRLIGILRPEAKDIWVVTVFSAVVSLLALATPVTVEALVNTVAFGRLMQPVIVLSLVLLGFLGFAAAIRVLQSFVAEIIQRRLFVRVVADLSQRLPRVRQDAYEGAHGPELLNRFFDVMTVQKSAALLVLDGIAIVLQTTVGMAVLGFYHPLLLGFNFGLLVAIAFIVLVLGRGGVATSIEESKAKYAVAAWLEQLALCPLTFKNAGGAERAVESADQLTINYLQARERHFGVLIRQITFTLGLQAVAVSTLLGIGGWLVIQGQLTLGQLVAAELIVAVIVGSFAKLGKHLEAYYDLLSAVDKLGHLFDLPVERQQGESLRAKSRGMAVRFGNHEIAAGELVAIVGSPGSGKSRLLAAAFGLPHGNHPATQLDGIDVGSLDLTALRSQVALVRHCEIFSGTLVENVHLNRPEGSLAAVRTCLEELGLREDLRRLPAGLDTIVQPGGAPLTDSQSRCIVLARALLSKPRLLLIDSLLDGLPDEALPLVMEALARRTTDTTIVIATGRNDVARLCHRSIALPPPSHAGSTVATGPEHSHPH